MIFLSANLILALPGVLCKRKKVIIKTKMPLFIDIGDGRHLLMPLVIKGENDTMNPWLKKEIPGKGRV